MTVREFAPETSRTKCLVQANIELFYSSFAENEPTTSEPSSETDVSLFSEDKCTSILNTSRIKRMYQVGNQR